jgi:RNA polymerase sigma-70 factor (ECF subfamily)
MPSTNLELADDSDLVAAIGRGESRAVDEIVRRHRAGVQAFARRLVGDDARAEEISQDVFVRLWERWDRYDPARGTLRAFLLALTHGRALDVARSDAARARREERDSRHHSSQLDADPSARVVSASVDTIVRTALDALPENERRALELAYYDGHSYKTVAAMLGEPEGTVKARIRRSLVKLRRALADQELRE